MDTNQLVNEILLRYPGISLDMLPPSEIIRFAGNLRVEGHWYRLTICCPQFPSLLNMQMRLQQGLNVAHFTSDTAKIQSNWTLHDLIASLPTLMPPPSRNLNDIQQSATLKLSHLYSQIAEIYSPSDYTVHIEGDAFRRIRFSKFKDFNDHYFELELPSLQLLEHSLPECEGVIWSEMFANSSKLSSIVQQFIKHLDDLRDFYAQFVDIDELCYVVQPAPPTTKHNWRLFLLRERVFIKLVIANPFAPTSSMSLHIIGPTYEVEGLRCRYNEGLKEWDSELDIHKNLLRIFDLCFFPMPPNGEGADAGKLESIFCNICYCHQMDGEIPIVSCDNPNCTLIYHAVCLLEWFKTLADGKIFLDVSFGTCPACKTKLSTSFTELLAN